MNLSKFLFRDSKGNKSVTMTSFVLGFLVVNFKLIMSGIEVGATKFTEFSGSDYGVALGALGAIYVLRRSGSDTTSADNGG